MLFVEQKIQPKEDMLFVFLIVSIRQKLRSKCLPLMPRVLEAHLAPSNLIALSSDSRRQLQNKGPRPHLTQMKKHKSVYKKNQVPPFNLVYKNQPASLNKTYIWKFIKKNIYLEKHIAQHKKKNVVENPLQHCQGGDDSCIAVS